ncbi:MAG: RNA polymerase sigma factor, partial [Planctomycetota bacterium]
MESPSPESLLAHASWVRGLARSLLHDDQAADDVVQEAWLAALRRPPRRLTRGWLGRVVRNAAATHWRRESRLRGRERGAAKPESIRSTGELAAEADWQRHVVAAVLALDDPYREVVLLRYFEDLTPQEIAVRLGEPAGTIRSRLKRGLDQIRARFDRENGGDRRAWMLALVPLAARGAPAARAASTLLVAGALIAIGIV